MMAQSTSYFKKLILSSIALFLALTFFIFLSLPTFFSTHLGKEILFNLITRRSSAIVEASQLSLSWFGQQKIMGLKAHFPFQKISLTCQAIESDAGLFQILFKNVIGHCLISSPALIAIEPLELNSFTLPFSILPRVHSASTLPIPAFDISLSRVQKWNGSIHLDQGSIQMQPIFFHTIQGSFELGNTPSLLLKAETEERGENGSFIIEAMQTEKLVVNASCHALPLSGIDQIYSAFYPDYRSFLLTLLGPTLQGEFSLEATKENLAFSIHALSQNLNANLKAISSERFLTLETPGKISLHFTPQAFQQLSLLLPELKPLQLAQPTTLQCVLSHLKAPFPLKIDQARLHCQIQALDPADFILGDQKLTLHPLALFIDKEEINSEVQLHLNSRLHYLEQGGKIDVAMTAMGIEKIMALSAEATQLPLELFPLGSETQKFLGKTANLQLDLQQSPRGLLAILQLQTPFLSLSPMHFKMQKALALSHPVFFSYRATPTLLSSLEKPTLVKGTISNFNIALEEKPLWNLAGVLDPFQTEMAGMAWKMDSIELQLQGTGLECSGNLMTSRIAINKIDTQEVHSIEQLSLPFSHRSSQLAGQMTAFIREGTLKVDLTLDNSIAQETGPHVDAMIDLQNVPSAFLETCFSQDSLSALLGKHFTAQLKIKTQAETQQLSLDWKSPLLMATLRVLKDQQAVQLQHAKNQIEWTLTPEGYLALDRLTTQGAPPFSLQQDAHFFLQPFQFFLPVHPQEKNDFLSLRNDLSKLQIKLHASVPKLEFFDKLSHETFSLNNLRLSLDKEEGYQPFLFTLKSAILMEIEKARATKTGDFSLEASFLSPTKILDPLQFKVNLDFKAHHFPTRVLDLFVRSQGQENFPFSTLFGATIESSLTTKIEHFSGPIQCNLRSPNTLLNLKGCLTQGILHLDQPFYLQMHVTPGISKLILNEVNPLDLTSFYTDNPVSLQIPHEKVQIPLYPFRKETLDIPHLKIELGKVFCRNEGNPSIALDLLKAKQTEQNRDLTLWFAPIDLHLNKGSIHLERTEILLDNTYDLALWGNLDLLKTRLDMNLGLTADALKKAFGLKNLPDNYVLLVPMKGPLNRLKIDSGRASAKIALLLAWQEASIAGGIAGGPAGALIGGLLGKVVTPPDQEAKVPPPKRPFPWEIETTKRASQHGHMRHFKQHEKPWKQLLKVIH